MTPHFPFSFFVKTSFATLSYPNKTVSGLSESECAEACLYESDFDCLSVDYYWPTEYCMLSVASATSLGYSLTTNKYYNYYEKLVGECSFPAVGLEDGTVSLDDVSMSSFLGDTEDGPIGISKASIRLNSDGAWCSQELGDVNSISEWVQIEFNEFKIIGAVATQGFRHPDLDPIYVTQYYLKYTNATDQSWIEYEESGQTKIFEANTDQDTVVKNELAHPFVAKFVRLYPVACRNHPCLRLELYACRGWIW
ncbi:lactadherin-like [Acanthaster planci]|uniref:Lactadherin-like n=1 Tax=Acanthaster planci TaxID=133434 RepID=A0A8B7ZRG8_ACAPL|nr:lactadherin-like [Acanthaster planci]